MNPWAFYPESVCARTCVFLCGLPDRSLCQITRLVLKPDRPDYLSNQIVPDCSSSQIVQVISNARLRGSPDCEVRQIAGVAPDMRTGASGIASKIFQRRLGYHRSCSRYQYVIWGLQHRLSSPRILLQGGSGIAGVVPGTNVGLRLSSPTTINTLGLEGRCCRTTPLWGNSLSVFLPTHLNADSFGTEGSSGVHVSPKIVGAPMAFISSNNLWVLWSMCHQKVCGCLR